MLNEQLEVIARVGAPSDAELLLVLYTENLRPGFRGSMCGLLLPLAGGSAPQMAVRVGPKNGADQRLMQVLLLRVQPHGLGTYAQALWNLNEELVDVELRGGKSLNSSNDYDRAMRAMRLARFGVKSFGGRKPRSRTGGMDYQLWADKARRLRKFVRHDGVSLPGAIARLELNLSERQGRRWLDDIDEDDPEPEIRP